MEFSKNWKILDQHRVLAPLGYPWLPCEVVFLLKVILARPLQSPWLEICITNRNIGFSCYWYTCLVSRLLGSVVPSSLCYHILRLAYQALVSSIDLDPVSAVFVPVAYFFDIFTYYFPTSWIDFKITQKYKLMKDMVYDTN